MAHVGENPRSLQSMGVIKTVVPQGVPFGSDQIRRWQTAVIRLLERVCELALVMRVIGRSDIDELVVLCIGGRKTGRLCVLQVGAPSYPDQCAGK
jgi:hypothetical protein